MENGNVTKRGIKTALYRCFFRINLPRSWMDLLRKDPNKVYFGCTKHNSLTGYINVMQNNFMHFNNSPNAPHDQTSFGTLNKVAFF